MRKKSLFAMALALAVSLPAASLVLAGEEGAATGNSASITLGTVNKGGSESPNRASEYSSSEVKENNFEAVGGGALHIADSDLSLDLEGMFQGVDEQEYRGHLEYQRLLEVEAGYTEFYHRLPQDELLHLQATSAAPGQGAQLWHSYDYAPNWDVNSNTAPAKDFGIEWRDLEVKGAVRIPQVPGLVVGVGQRLQERVGSQQVMGMSKCGSCHIVAHDKEINETTQDISPYLHWNVGQFAVQYDLLLRKFTNDGAPVVQLYDIVENPLDGASAEPGGLYDRVNYGNGDNPLETARTTENDKVMHTVKAKYDINAGNSLTAGYVNADITNTNVAELSGPADGGSREELEMQYDAGMMSYAGQLAKGLSLVIKSRYTTIDNDDAPVDLKGTALLPDKNDFVRESDENRDVWNATADLKYRLSNVTTLLAGYQYEGVKREHADFLVNEDTASHTFKGKAKMRFGSTFNLTTGYQYVMVPEPYTSANAAFPTHIDLGVNELGNWDGVIDNPVTDVHVTLPSRTATLYSYTDYVYNQRTHNLSAKPANEHELKVKANWAPVDKLYLSAYGRYTMGDNDKDLFYQYQDDVIDAGLDLTVTPLTQVSLTFGYNFFNHKTESQFYIPYYHG